MDGETGGHRGHWGEDLPVRTVSADCDRWFLPLCKNAASSPSRPRNGCCRRWLSLKRAAPRHVPARRTALTACARGPAWAGARQDSRCDPENRHAFFALAATWEAAADRIERSTAAPGIRAIGEPSLRRAAAG